MIWGIQSEAHQSRGHLGTPFPRTLLHECGSTRASRTLRDRTGQDRTVGGQSPAFAKWPEKLVSHLGAKMAQKGAETLSSTPPGPEKWGSPLALGESTPKISQLPWNFLPRSRRGRSGGWGRDEEKEPPKWPQSNQFGRVWKGPDLLSGPETFPPPPREYPPEARSSRSFGPKVQQVASFAQERTSTHRPLLAILWGPPPRKSPQQGLGSRGAHWVEFHRNLPGWAARTRRLLRGMPGGSAWIEARNPSLSPNCQYPAPPIRSLPAPRTWYPG